MMDADGNGTVEYEEFVGELARPTTGGSTGRRGPPPPAGTKKKQAERTALLAEAKRQKLQAEAEQQLAKARGEAAQHKESTMALAGCVEETVAENMRLSGELVSSKAL
eukprot:SAG22_NODE_3564_length_1640_cov_1.006489_1_plen_107_part_10